MNASDLLHVWGNLGRLHQTSRLKQRASWEAVSRLIQTAQPKLIADGLELRSLLDESRRRLEPFGDPFDLDMGLHRWLAADREEAYSDWLQWIVEQIRRPALVYEMFKLYPSVAVANWDVPPIVEREVTIPTGHTGCSGRLDLVIRYRSHALVVVEVKKGSAEEADTMKQEGYEKWIRDQPEPEKHSVLLVTNAELDEYNRFSVVLWRDICVFLRKLAAKKDGQQNHTSIGLMLAFVGAVEQNLLLMSASHIRQVAAGKSLLFNPYIVDHLRSSVK